MWYLNNDTVQIYSSSNSHLRIITLRINIILLLHGHVV